MKAISIKDIALAVKGKVIYGEESSQVAEVSTDSRKVSEESLFVPLIGERFDGHDFIEQVISSGCKNLIISDKKKLEFLADKSINVIQVIDTTVALQELAKYYLKRFNIKTIGITGSTGKTSTKDMVYAIFKEKFKTDCNKGNFNNHIGLPLTVLSFKEDTEVGVLEMGMDKSGEIELLADIAKPSIGIITNIGLSHIENFTSQEGIFKAKMEITKFFTKENTLIINESEEFLKREKVQGDYKTVVTGESNHGDIDICNIVEKGKEGIEFDLIFQGEKQHFQLPVLGRHNAFNGALAVAAGLEMGVSMATAAKGLSSMKLTEKRLTVREKGSIKVIDDTYNASPDSMKAAIDLLKSIKGKRKIAILGEMYELGENASKYHLEVGQYAKKMGIEAVYSIGTLAKNIAVGAEKIEFYYETKDLFWDFFKDNIKPEDVILVKGSRGMKMEELVEKILERGEK